VYKKMLIPLDRSELAEVVFPYAKEVAGRLGLEVTLLHVADEEEKNRISKYKNYLDGKAETLLNQAHYIQRSIKSPGKSAPVTVKSVLTAGNAAGEILNFIEKNKIDLVMMATHGRSGINRWALGSVADKVLRRSSVPVWLIRAVKPETTVSETWPKMKILVPLDGSKMAESVLPHVEILAKQKGVKAEITLLRVINTSRITGDYPKARTKLSLSAHVKERTEHFRGEYEKYLAGIAQNLSSAGIKAVSGVLVGAPADEIIEHANKNPYNLIVMATHGRSGVSRWAYGSAAEKVLRRSSRPLFLVRVLQADW